MKRLRRMVGSVTVAVLVLGLAAPALAVEVTPPLPPKELDQTQISLGFGWYTYLKFNKSEVRTVATKMGGVYAGAVAASTAVCTVVPGSIIVGSVCRAAMAKLGYSIWKAFTDAKKYSQCVQIAFSYTSWLNGIWVPVGAKRYAC